MLESPFNKVAVLRTCNFTKKTLCFPAKFVMAASGFPRQQIFFLAESGIYC